MAVASQGKTAVVVVTAEFEALAHTMAANAGRPGLRVLVLPYPLEARPEDLAWEKMVHAARTAGQIAVGGGHAPRVDAQDERSGTSVLQMRAETPQLGEEPLVERGSQVIHAAGTAGPALGADLARVLRVDLRAEPVDQREVTDEPHRAATLVRDHGVVDRGEQRRAHRRPHGARERLARAEARDHA